MATKVISRAERLTGDQKLIEGLEKHEAILPFLVIAGASFKTADVIGILQARISAAGAAVSTRAAWQTQVKADHDERAKTTTLVSGLRQALQVAFAGSIDALADFGLEPCKTRVVTPEQKAAAAAKAKATRRASHDGYETEGSCQLSRTGLHEGSPA
jgi:hypothetical protein